MAMPERLNGSKPKGELLAGEPTAEPPLRPEKPAYRFTGEIPPALAHLRDEPCWVAWGYVWKNGRWTKPPLNPRTGRLASVSNPTTWATFDVAVGGAERHGVAGVGLVLTDDGDIIGIDLDDCITDAGTFSPLAAEIIGYGESYAEVSPSGEGIRIFVRGKIEKALKDDVLGVDIYGTGRYLTVTGNKIGGAPDEIRPAPRGLASLTAIIGGAREAKRSKSDGKARATGADFFAKVNATALTHPDDWVPILHPTARKQPNGALRVTSKDLGRDLEEDLSYHPSGIEDFGTREKLTPIDAVLAYGPVTDSAEAAIWLCGRMEIEPASLGWSGMRFVAEKNSGAQKADASSGDAAAGNDSRQTHDSGRSTHSQTLIDIATGDGVELYHSPDGTAYADILVNGHRETWPTRSSGFKGWLRRAYYEETGGAPNSNAMLTAMGIIDARAQFDGVTRHVYLRVAARTTLDGDEAIYIDIGDDAWDAIEVDAEGHRIVKSPPVRFRRSPGMLALPRPLLGGNIGELRRHLNLTDEAFVLAVGWLLSALRGCGPYPILLLSGEQGTGKSTAADRLRRLVDPHAAPLRALPRDVRDLAIAANNAHVLAFDNLSGIAADIADALCRLSTGGGFATRALYSDDEERFFDGRRPIVMNSIVDIATRPDLADRGLVAVLEAIAAEERKTDKEVRAAFDKAAPHILGALLDAVAHGLKREPGVRLNRKPRMADHATWVRSCEPLNTQVGEGRWYEGLHLDTYDKNRDEAAEIVLESDQVAMALRRHMEMRSESTLTSTELLKTLTDLETEHARPSKDWPSNGRALSGRLRRLAPALRSIGIVLSFGREGHDRRRLITITKLRVHHAYQE
jgi:hypothetical protein